MSARPGSPPWPQALPLGFCPFSTSFPPSPGPRPSAQLRMRCGLGSGLEQRHACALCPQNVPLLCPPEYMVCFLHRLISALRCYWDEYKASNPHASVSEGEWALAEPAPGWGGVGCGGRAAGALSAGTASRPR